jgi:hypothetical protein
MSFFNEKWKNSSILIKVVLCAMLLNSLLLLVGAITLLSWEKMLGVSYGYWILLSAVFLYNSLLSFGIFKVNGFARFFTILEGLGSLLIVGFFIAGYKYVVAAARDVVGDAAFNAAGAAAEAAASSGLVASLFKIVLSMIPPKVLGMIGFYLIVFLGPYILQLFSMLLLFFCGKDFKKIKKEEVRLTVS